MVSYFLRRAHLPFISTRTKRRHYIPNHTSFISVLSASRNMELKPVEIEAASEHSSESTDVSSLSLFTNLDKEWELDSSRPSLHNASIFYMKPSPQYDTEKPYFFNVPVEASWSPKVKQTNVCYTRKTVAIADVRGHERIFSLDRHGFQLGNFVTSLSYDEFASTDVIVGRYYEEVKQFLKENIGAIDVLPFDFQVY